MFLPSCVTVRVPATSANLGPGFDCLGLALKLHTTFTVELLPENACASLDKSGTYPLIEISSTWGDDPAISALPVDHSNLFYQTLAHRLATLGMPVPPMRIHASIGIPPGRGLGSSATAVVGGLLAADALAGHFLHTLERRIGAGQAYVAPQCSEEAPLQTAVLLERGSHSDNVAAALLGGLVVTTRDERNHLWHAIRVPVPHELRAVLFVPLFPMDTVAGRALLPAHYTKADAVHNVGHVALLLAALSTGDLKGIGAAMDDRFHEPYRAQLFPQLPALLQAAREVGAHGACLSGGGSTILALATERVQEVAQALTQVAQALNITGRVIITGINHCGASVETQPQDLSHTPPGERKESRIRREFEVREQSGRSQGMASAGWEPHPSGRPQGIAPTRDEERSNGGRENFSLEGWRARPALYCPNCEERFTLERTDYRCGCGQPLDVDIGDVGTALDGSAWRRRFDERLRSMEAVERSGVWRFRDLLFPLPDITSITRPEGQTNLYAVGRAQQSGGHGRIGEFVGMDRLWLKHEGENPTGSFKDRGMTVGVSVATWLGASAVACASTGNTSASMAAYAAQAGLRAIVLLPEGKVAAGKLAQARAYGAEMRQVAGDFDRAMINVERMCLDEGIYLLNSLNPFRLLGQQSLALEVLQQFGWDVPDWIALPAGNLGNTSALGTGLLRAYQAGLIARLPRIIAVQAAGANPFYQSYLQDFTGLHPVKAHTIASAINIGNPVSFLRAKTVIQATDGLVAQVTDDEILQAKAVIDRAGIGCEPASAASVAGVRQLVAAGVIYPEERVVAILTGNLLKDPEAIQ